MGQVTTPREIDRARCFPGEVAKSVKQAPRMLNDMGHIQEVSKALIKAGYRAELLEASESLCVSAKTRLQVRQACFAHGTVH